jgi:putative iron-regulated protein
MKKLFFSLSVLSLSLATVSCSNDDGTSNQDNEKAEVVENYADIVYANYSEAYWDATELETVINDFIAAPTQEAFDNVKLKWKEARESYGSTEAFRFNGSPVQNSYDQLNAWPLDENYIDYIDTDATTGIINNTTTYPTLTKELLAGLNKQGGDKNISVGYHAIEFLLWGQDLTAPADALAGQRPYTDFVTDGTGTAANQDRRGLYLSLCADLLTDKLAELMNVWAQSGSYRTTFLALNTDTALQNIYSGILNVVENKMTGNFTTAVQGMAQENEESDFSDNTQRDFMSAFNGVLNVYRGQYGTVAGISLQALVYAKDKEVYSDTEDAIDLVEDSLDVIVYPFDYAISGGTESEEGKKVVTAATNLTALATQLVVGANTIEVTIQ